MAKVVLLTNIPAPYREKMHELVSEYFKGFYTVVYCAEKESNRKWEVQYGNYDKQVLSKINDNAIHNNPEIIKSLNKLNPDVVVIMGFYPSMLYAYLWTIFKSRKLIVFTDGTLISESSLSIIHKIVRKIVFKKAKAFIGPSNGSAELYESYGIDKSKFFRTYLAINNSLFLKESSKEKKFDLMFSGQFIDRKMPLFFVEIARIVKEQYGKCSVLILGNGILEREIVQLLESYSIEYSYPGFISQEDLPSYYTQAKLFLFPTRNDPWGVVANEAMASGLPVITCMNAGVANDLVVDGFNGYVLPLSEKVWADKVISIFNSQDEYKRLSENALKHVQIYSSENAAKGIFLAVNSVI
ncbi:glycosyltransferase family 4 protein [Flavobacterium sp. WC2509]|uniref:glycosyltransferase family 4 protein n=1 Tax=Flavobacterium sp. WC2509 TaxID=3461406 RepID=UPI0040444B3C